MSALPPIAPLLDPAPAPELLRALVEEQAPALAELPVVQLPGGRDNAAFRIGDELVARLPLHEAAALLMRHEQRWLPQLAAALPLATSAPVVSGEPGCGYPSPWSVARWIAGGTADRTPYDDAAMAAGLTDLWRALHRPAPGDAPANPVRSCPLSDRLPRFDEHLHRLRHPDPAPLVRELEALAAVPAPDVPPRWCHGDLHPRNLVVRDRRLVGVIDWGDLHGGDPVVDHAAAWMLLPLEEVEPLRRCVDTDDDSWQRARGWALVFGALLMLIGHDDGDAAFFNAGRRTLERAMSQD